MGLSWTMHRFDRESNGWVDTDGPTAQAEPGVFAPADPELEVSLVVDGRAVVRDVIWPLVWHLCFEPVVGRARGQHEWTYTGFATGTRRLRLEDIDLEYADMAGGQSLVPAGRLWMRSSGLMAADGPAQRS